jgi:hypothetical protein
MEEIKKDSPKETENHIKPDEKKEEVVEKKDGVAEETNEVKTEKKGSGCAKGCLIAFLVVFFILALMGGGVYLGYRRVLKAMEPVDLGVEYTEDDYNSLMGEIGLDADPSVLCIDCPTPVYFDPHEVAVTVSNAQASAAFEYINQHMSNASIKGTQIKMGDGIAELSTTLTFQGREFPIYMSGTISRDSERTIEGEIYELKAGALTVPVTLQSFVESSLVDLANTKISDAGDTVRIDSIELTEGGLNFEGLIPSKAQ